ncbi:hypothetical protein AB0B25_04460 [Nocardia sp. NPDC049190]|uniref:hypothetical protein n=1 Tax=Nocardia sp. NPDC049190 TaxID=3155650 RepID=UPI0033CA73BF
MTAAVDQDEFAARASLPDVVHGYRFDGIRPNGTIGFYGGPEAVAQPRIGDRPKEDRARWTPAAFCVRHRHIAPDWDCWCGWHMVADFTELSGYKTEGLGFDVVRGRDDITARPVIAEVTARGPKLPGVNLNDPPSTVRATWLRLEGRIWIHESVSRPIVRAARRRYSYARIERYGSVAELATAVEAGEN